MYFIFEDELTSRHRQARRAGWQVGDRQDKIDRVLAPLNE